MIEVIVGLLSIFAIVACVAKTLGDLKNIGEIDCAG